jgi:hypothetical protein
MSVNGLGHQLQGMVQRTLFQSGTLTEPGTVQAVLLAPGTAFVVYVFRHRIEQPPGGARG